MWKAGYSPSSTAGHAGNFIPEPSRLLRMRARQPRSQLLALYVARDRFSRAPVPHPLTSPREADLLERLQREWYPLASNDFVLLRKRIDCGKITEAQARPLLY